MCAVMLLSLLIQHKLTSRFEKYSGIPNSAGMTGAEVARKMLRDHGIDDVEVVSVPGMLTDHYNPLTRKVNLSEAVYTRSSIAAAAVAAHECGHAVQHARGYLPLQLRSVLVPVVNVCNMAVSWVLLAGVIFLNVFPQLIWVGIGLFAMTTLFSFLTLPVEINASTRAVAWLEHSGIASYETRPMAVDALRWAAYTYVIAAVGSLATLFYYISLASSRR